MDIEAYYSLTLLFVYTRLLVTYIEESSMMIESVNSPKGDISLLRREGSPRLSSGDDFLALMSQCPARTIAIGVDDLDPRFFDLSSGLAGEILQKVSNFRLRLAIVGDLDAFPSEALRAFVAESNRTGQVVFAAELQAAIGLLRPERSLT
jgi:hypothetical protein